MLGIFGGFDPLVVVERDRAVVDVEVEIAVGALVVLPPLMSFPEEVVGDLLDGVFHRVGYPDDVRAAPFGMRDLQADRRRSDIFVACLGGDVLDLAAIAIAIERDFDGRDAGLGERVEQGRLVLGTDGFAELREFLFARQPRGGVERRARRLNCRQS